jgi:hypothetical protein
MKFQPFDDSQLPELMSWFRNADELRTWGGPPFRFPFTDTTFREDAKLSSLPTWSLVEDGQLAAFGQCYLRVGRCHFGRVAVSPKVRSRGHGTTLIREMAIWGSKEFSANEYSLFVIASKSARDRALPPARVLRNAVSGAFAGARDCHLHGGEEARGVATTSS